ncbi:MAG TPA: hypothetical protein VHE55_04975 [Fimbriimonadaceae bacterium]|nr:hypothetical protein [Fimbriimonadaceae bacterium]
MARTAENRLALCIVASATIGIAQAQENIFRPVPGAKEVGISGAVSSVGGVTTYDFIVDGGVYVTDRLVALARVGFSKHSPLRQAYFLGARFDVSRGTTTPYAIAGIEFHKTSVPQSMGGGGYISRIDDPSASLNATVYQGGIGMDFFLSSHMSAFAELVAFKASGGNNTGTNLRVGLRVFFK